MVFIVDYLKENTAIDFEYVKLPVLFPERGPKYILADYRDYLSYADHPHWCVHNATSSPFSLLRNLRWASRNKEANGGRLVMVFEAMSRSQVAAWLMAQGYQTSTQVHPNHVIPGTLNVQERTMISSTEREIERLERVAYEARQRAQFLRTLPTQPKRVRVVEGQKQPKAGVIFFERTFGGTRVYTYAAVKASDGLWYTTGPRTPKGFQWRELIAWINAEGPVVVYRATLFEALNTVITAGMINAGSIVTGTLSENLTHGGVEGT